MSRLKVIDDALMDGVREEARQSPRHRHIRRFHEHHERVQRMINCIEPESYVRPHRHQDPDQVELFVALRGKAIIVEFDDHGGIVASVTIAARGAARGVEIPPRTWHMVLALEPGTTLLEIAEGPYDAATHKRWPTWAPPEGVLGASRFVAEIRRQLGV